MQEGIKTVVGTSVEEAVKDADIINTCTLATSPILQSSFVKQGAHINGKEGFLILILKLYLCI